MLHSKVQYCRALYIYLFPLFQLSQTLRTSIQLGADSQRWKVFRRTKCNLNKEATKVALHSLLFSCSTAKCFSCSTAKCNTAGRCTYFFALYLQVKYSWTWITKLIYSVSLWSQDKLEVYLSFPCTFSASIYLLYELFSNHKAAIR